MRWLLQINFYPFAETARCAETMHGTMVAKSRFRKKRETMSNLNGIMGTVLFSAEEIEKRITKYFKESGG
jgi:hypothetical protein